MKNLFISARNPERARQDAPHTEPLLKQSGDVLTAEGVMEMLGLMEEELAEWVRSGNLHSFRTGERIYFDFDTVIEVAIRTGRYPKMAA